MVIIIIILKQIKLIPFTNTNASPTKKIFY